MITVTESIRVPYRLEIGVISEKGKGHMVNEDSYYVDPKYGLFLLADGMGGHQAGEIASRLAVSTLYHALTTLPPEGLEQTLGRALMIAHLAILEKAEENEAYRGMGTTALIGWIRIPELLLWTAHVGNSRAYLWRNGKLRQLTEDHTLLNELHKAGLLPPNRNQWPSPAILTQALGSKRPFLAPDFGEWSLQIGDRLLFCSDGISDVLTAQKIQTIISGNDHPQQICEHLAGAVREKGAPDDFTAIIVMIVPAENGGSKVLEATQIMEVKA